MSLYCHLKKKIDNYLQNGHTLVPPSDGDINTQKIKRENFWIVDSWVIAKHTESIRLQKLQNEMCPPC